MRVPRGAVASIRGEISENCCLQRYTYTGANFKTLEERFDFRRGFRAAFTKKRKLSRKQFFFSNYSQGKLLLH